MKILHIANFAYNASGRAYYNVDRKLSAGFVKNKHFVYEYSIRDMARMSTIFRTKKMGGSKVNTDIINICANLQPDLILLGHADEVTPQTLKTIRQNHPKIKIAVWYVDALFLWGPKDKTIFIQKWAPYLDAVFVTTGGEYLEKFLPSNVVRAYIPNPVESSIDSLQNFKKREFEYELVFCGTLGNDERGDFLKGIQTGLSDLPLSFNGSLGFPKVQGAEYFHTLAKSRMGLNYSRRNDVCLYSSDRIAHMTGNGLLTFTPKIPQFDLIYKEDEVVYFETLDELVEKARFYRSNVELASRIAEKGWLRAHQSCSSQRVARFMEETIFQLPYSESYEWSAHIFKN